MFPIIKLSIHLVFDKKKIFGCHWNFLHFYLRINTKNYQKRVNHKIIKWNDRKLIKVVMSCWFSFLVTLLWYKKSGDWHNLFNCQQHSKCPQWRFRRQTQASLCIFFDNYQWVRFTESISHADSIYLIQFSQTLGFAIGVQDY